MRGQAVECTPRSRGESARRSCPPGPALGPALGAALGAAGEAARGLRAAAATAVLIGAALAGCKSPLGTFRRSDRLDQTITATIDREIASLPEVAPTRETTRAPSDALEELSSRREELDRIGPATPSARTEFDLGPDLTGGPQEVVLVSLEAVIRTAVENNLTVSQARFEPAINREDIIEAQAAFDFVLFGDSSFDKIDEPGTTPVVEGVGPIGVPIHQNETYRFSTGVRKETTYGGQLFVSTDLSRYRNKAPGLTLVPDPAYTARVDLGLTQPLLRGFGQDVNTATIRFAENAEARSVAQVEGELLGLVFDVEAAYWGLLQQWRNAEIQQWLINEGILVRDVLDRRRDFDTKLAQYSDAVARVEQRKADFIRAQRDVRAASNRLKVLINDPHLTIASESVLLPADAFVDAPITYNVREAALTAIDRRPEVRQALLGIDDAALRQAIADNARLPLLDLSANIGYVGLDDDAGSAYSDTFDADYIDYFVGLHFEYPLGNRGPEAAFRRARLERSQSLFAYRQTIQDVLIGVKSALRDVIAAYELIEATRSNRVAQAENLRTLQVEEETLASLTPEFLDLKFQRQDRLAIARAQEVGALVAFDQSVAALYRAMGTGLSMHKIDFEQVSGVPEAGRIELEDAGDR